MKKYQHYIKSCFTFKHLRTYINIPYIDDYGFLKGTATLKVLLSESECKPLLNHHTIFEWKVTDVRTVDNGFLSICWVRSHRPYQIFINGITKCFAIQYNFVCIYNDSSVEKKWFWNKSVQLAMRLAIRNTNNYDLWVGIWTVSEILSKDHWRFVPYTPIFLIPRMLLLSFWCGACSISTIGESNGKSQLAKYFQNSYALQSYGG